MKILAALLLLFGGIDASASASASEARAAISHCSQALKREFKFVALQSTDWRQIEKSPSGEELVLLPRFEVIDSNKGVEQALADDRRKKEEEKFSWKRGGTILKHVGKKITAELMFKFDPDHGLTFVKISW
jgi:hypothetical protein